MVPVTEDYLTIDYIRDRKLPAIVVTNGRLGSISDTLLTLDALGHRSIPVAAVIYNPFFDSDKTIASETVEYLKRYLNSNFPDTRFLMME